MQRYLTDDLTKQMYNAMILPIFDYCDTLYGTTDNDALTKLQRLQNRAGKILLQKPIDTDTDKVLSDLKWIPLHKRVFYHTQILMYKCLNGLAPKYLADNFKYVTHEHYTRYHEQNMLYVSKTKLAITTRSLKYQGAINWNSLPTNCRTAPTLSTFKPRVLKHMSSI